MEVETIWLIKSSGEIFLSIEDDTPEFNERQLSFYVTVKTDSSEYAAIRADAQCSGEIVHEQRKLSGQQEMELKSKRIKGERDEKNLYHYTGFGAGIRIL